MMPRTDRTRPVEIMIVEDNPGDVDLIREALGTTDVPKNLNVVADGEEALEWLARDGGRSGAVLPDIILLDLNLPRKDGRQVLAEIKQSERWRHIPVVVLSSSSAEHDLQHTYQHHANCFVTKPVDLEEFLAAVQAIEHFWVRVAQLPQR